MSDKALVLPWHRAIAIESRRGARMLEALRVDAKYDGKIEGFLPNPPTGGEGGWICAKPGDYIVREAGASWVITAEEFDRDWIDPVAETAKAAQRAAQAEADRIAEEKKEADRKAQIEADAKRLLDEKRDREKRERDGSAA